MKAILWAFPISKKKVAGLTLIERARRAARKAGAFEAKVVTDLKEAESFTKGEGFFFIRGDTVFEMEVMESLAGEAGAVPDKFLAVSPSDRGDASGLYYAPPDFFQVLDRAGSFEEAIKLFEAAGRLRPVRAESGLLWRVSNPLEVRAAERRLRLSLYRSLRRPTENWALRNLNRPLSRWISYLLVRTPLTPNQISVSVILISVLTAWFLAQGDLVSVAIGGLLFQFRSILDCCDGEVARLKLAWSKKGQWIDTVSDNASYLIFLAGVALGASRQGFAATWILAVATFVGTLLSLSLMFTYLIRFTNSGSLLTVDADFTSDVKRQESNGWIRLLLKVKFLMKKDYFSLVFMGLCLFGKLSWILVLATIGTNLVWILLLTMKKEFARVPLRPEAGR